MKNFIITFFVAVLVAAMAGGGAYYWQQGRIDQLESDLKDLKEKISNLTENTEKDSEDFKEEVSESKDESLEEVKEDQGQKVIIKEENDIYQDWKKYKNKDRGFQIKYPKNWTFTETKNKDDFKTGQVASLKAPKSSSEIVIFYWDDINNEYALGGENAKEGDYKDLKEYITSEGTLKDKTGEIVLNGQDAYEVEIHSYSSNYGVMVENDGIYEISFVGILDSLEMNSVEKHILSTFKFIK